MATTIWGYAECVSILHRKRTIELISAVAYREAVTVLQQEVLISNDFRTLTIEDERVLAGLSLVMRHNLNSNDAAILATYLRYQTSLPAGSPSCLLITADQRLIRASETEGLATLNPEHISASEATVWLANSL